VSPCLRGLLGSVCQVLHLSRAEFGTDTASCCADSGDPEPNPRPFDNIKANRDRLIHPANTGNLVLSIEGLYSIAALAERVESTERRRISAISDQVLFIVVPLVSCGGWLHQIMVRESMTS
jgi:hypothetical protein